MIEAMHNIYVGVCHFAGKRKDFVRCWKNYGEEQVCIAVRDGSSSPERQELSKKEWLALLAEANDYAQEHEAVLRLEGIHTSGGWSAGLCFGDLADIGLLHKQYIPDGYGTSTIRWTVVGNVLFTDDRGKPYQRGDIVDWPK